MAIKLEDYIKALKEQQGEPDTVDELEAAKLEKAKQDAITARTRAEREKIKLEQERKQQAPKIDSDKVANIVTAVSVIITSIIIIITFLIIYKSQF